MWFLDIIMRVSAWKKNGRPNLKLLQLDNAHSIRQQKYLFKLCRRQRITFVAQLFVFSLNELLDTNL